MKIIIEERCSRMREAVINVEHHESVINIVIQIIVKVIIIKFMGGVSAVIS